MQSSSRGKIVTWKADKAYGFIRPNEGGKDVFVHLRDFGRIGREPRVGDVVSFQRMSAELTPRSGDLLISLLFFCALVYLAARHGLPVIVVGVCAIASLVAFLMYAFDKSAAMNRRWRTSGSTLLVAGLVGGWPGALVAQGMFRHKSTKVSFQAAFWLTVIANCAAIAWFSFRAGVARWS